MKRFIACIVGAAIAAAAADLAATAAPPETDKTAAADWTESGRWLTPYEMPGYDGYAVTWPVRQTAQAAQPPARAFSPEDGSH